MALSNGTLKMTIAIAVISLCGFFLFASYSYKLNNRKNSFHLPEFSNNHVNKKQKIVSNDLNAKYSSDENSEEKTHLKTEVPNSIQYSQYFMSTKTPEEVVEETTASLDEKILPNKDKDMSTETKDFPWKFESHGKKAIRTTAVPKTISTNGRSDSKSSKRKKSHHSPIQRSRAPKWFSKEDIDKMTHLATWNISHLETIPEHPHVDKIVFDNTGKFEFQPTPTVCTDQCAVLKSYRDMYEVVAFHLDRVLGLNRALPAVARAFTGLGNLGLRYEDGRARPLIWWDPDLLHGGEFQEDQNSFELSWSTYQKVLRKRCWADGREPRRRDRCSVVHLEWARLAVFDFLLQVYDRLDRNCCGFQPTEQDKCLTDGRNADCDNPDRAAPLMLVHIFSSGRHPTRLVFLDNAGVPERREDNLDFRLLTGIDEVPRRAVEVLKSGRLGELLLRSLQVDKVFWDTQDRDELIKYVHILHRRGKILADYIEDKDIALVDDY
ncbi:PREDICTED: protein FAM198A-like [Branchiostoma belcheri]|uniref:Protein FAM198A-like n=1 Tax=Branchiostoma belcheri TaxID=7741 RepID=A0A6P4YPV2_BRABE|nr:PREDICTED: protein FAM198A-like [Branchiostoma belcheri]